MAVTRKAGPAVDLSKHLKTLGEYQAKVGWNGNANYPDGTPVAYVAAIHELGSPTNNIPPRPMLRPTADAKSGEWGQLAGKLANQVVKGNMDAASALEMLAMSAAGDVQETITALTTPALSPITVKRKGNSKPLVDTGHLLRTVTGVVERAGE